ncbi:hypothetical protein BGZ95_010223 [Linnemannia exigua]|uniref:Initiator tRNA phosphoribosyl transferase n=1 Tax=Linnemannia exigua TaxID=604196 RepID=A0AAD4DKJ5_9FUNG|nr:hypothetical protein BGZ95_010223 [Linnemannia exigua]
MSKSVEATQISTHGRNRDDMRRDAKSLLNRLRSIQADAAFVSEISDLFPQFPVIANERCGTWYVHPSKIHKPGVYFKSTDGHTGIWDFNLRRYNPHLITTIIKHGGCIIVDSTRKGKRVPDALSKTIPIWCATINNAVRKCALQNQVDQEGGDAVEATGRSISDKEKNESKGELQRQDESSPSKFAAAAKTTTTTTAALHPKSESGVGSGSTEDESGSKAPVATGVAEAAALLIPALNRENWDTRYHSLPSLISRSEHVQIADKIEGFADKLMRFTDMTSLTTKLLKPIRPIWLTPQSFLLRHDLPDYSQVAFLPVICLSASRVVQDGMEERDGYLYVQGSGDDEEMWSRGLKPELFWENEDYLLEEGISAEECEQRAVEVVREAKRKLMEKSKHRQQQQQERRGKAIAGQEGLIASEFGGYSVEGRVHFTPSMELCSEIKPSSIWIGNNASGRIPDCWNSGFDMVINCGAEIKRHPLCELHGDSEELRHVTVLGGAGQGGAQATLCMLQKHQWSAIETGETLSATTTMAEQLLALPACKEGEKNYFYLHLPIAEGKKGQHQLLEMIPMAIKAVRQMISATSNSKNDTCQEMARPRILVHCQQGMDRSVGITLALLVSCFDEMTGAYCGSGGDEGSTDARTTATKEMIQRRLFQIMSHRLAARPSRATLKMVNTFFMSPTDPPPAKYKS